MKRAKGPDAMEKVWAAAFALNVAPSHRDRAECARLERAVRRFKRAVRALLVERAEAAVHAATASGLTVELNAMSYKSASVLAQVVRAAVLKSPVRSTSPARAGKRG